MFLSDLRYDPAQRQVSSEHLPVQPAQEDFGQDFLALSVGPLFALGDVELFPLVQLALGGDVPGNQVGQFVGIERRAPAG